ncbi:zinc ribbon domain-containing protein [Microbacterium sp. SORGH_AS_0888]|uniref:zinc ribbon domain-containing protein n=1 Tax=Microbacterium sp. SORGH_AS_0888 TaxID=3041791 RepID=UPI0027892D11|nr:C4-type zinc ribbon domain-containing protein [Microbacterium sp. SORGH_AS_0888]MDQ1128600.1 putative nucleic acid-binding Zn-ribbon protein [Microbacterium sp. SORGH_AS_0888]
MNAAPADQLRLLDLADLDAQVAQTEQARRNPPQAGRVKELLEERQAQNRVLGERQGVVDDLKAELGRIEADVLVVDARQRRDTALLQTVSNPKDAAGLEHELASLVRRRSDLEDAQLEVMERLEEAEAEVAQQEALLATIGEEGARLSAEAKAVVADATERIARLERDRAAVSGSIPTDLVGMYERLRTRSAGAALLRARTCGGCHMVLSGTDLGTLRQTPPEAVATCPECGCILVRTSESGL